MIMEVVKFYWMCIRRAFAGSFWRAEKWSGGLAIVTAVIGAITHIGWGLNDDQDRLMTVYLPTLLFILVFAGSVFAGLLFAPYSFFKEERDKAVELAERQKPKMRIRLANPITSDIRFGTTSETAGGSRISAEASRVPAALIFCTNEGRETLRNCRCTLIAVWKKSANAFERVPFYESVNLGWSRDLDREGLLTDIEPYETRALYVAGIRANGSVWLYRKIEDLPFEYQKLLGERGEYQILLQFKTDLPDPLQVLLDIDVENLSVAGAPPHAKLAIVEQGVPPLRTVTV